MAFGLLLRKYPKAEIDTRVREAAEILGLTEFLDRKPKALSGGQRQRVAVGRAIVRRPQVFLFDEPLSNLDAKMRVQMRTEISRLHHRLGATMIYVTHDQVEAMTMGDRIVVMNQGQVQQVGAPLAIYEHPANRFVAGFIGSPQMNFIEGELAGEDGRLFFTEAGGAARLEVWAGHREALNAHGGKAVTLGVRPEDFKEAGAGVPEAEGWRELEARVDVVEPMGSEVYWYLKTGAHALVARLEPHARAAAGDEKRLVVNMAKAHFFDPVSEACIA
jgi:multiple sugar transport system ATP-binding protein